MCLLGACYETHTILRGYEVDPRGKHCTGYNSVTGLVQPFLEYDSGMRKGEGEEPGGSHMQPQLIETIPAPMKHLL